MVSGRLGGKPARCGRVTCLDSEHYRSVARSGLYAINSSTTCCPYSSHRSIDSSEQEIPQHSFIYLYRVELLRPHNSGHSVSADSSSRWSGPSRCNLYRSLTSACSSKVGGDPGRPACSRVFDNLPGGVSLPRGFIHRPPYCPVTSEEGAFCRYFFNSGFSGRSLHRVIESHAATCCGVSPSEHAFLTA